MNETTEQLIGLALTNRTCADQLIKQQLLDDYPILRDFITKQLNDLGDDYVISREALKAFATTRMTPNEVVNQIKLFNRCQLNATKPDPDLLPPS